MNTLDSILPELRSLLPASLRGAYLDGYLRRRRTPMELLLSRSLPNVDVAASTFEDLRAEIRALGLPLWVANRYLAEAEQALAVGHDTRDVIASAKAWLATSIPSGQDASASLERRYHVVVVNERTGEKHVVSRPDEPLTHAEGVTFMSKMSNRAGRRIQLEEVAPSMVSAADGAGCHVCSETGKRSCTACGTELASLGAHGEGCPRCAEQEMDVLDAQHVATSASGSDVEEDVTERVASDITYASRSSKLAAGAAAAKSLTPAREAVLARLDGRRLGFVSNAVIYDEGMRDLSKAEHKIALGLVLGGQLRVIKVMGSLPGTHAKSRIGAAGPSHYVLRRAPPSVPHVDTGAEPIDRFMAAYEPALYEALQKHPDEFAYTSAEVPGFLPRWRQALLTEDFNHDGHAMRGACKRLGIKCTKKALIEFLRPKAHSSAELSEPQAPRDSSGMAKREHYRREVQSLGLPFDEQNALMTAVDQALVFGQDVDVIIARTRAHDSPRAVTWSDLRKGDLVWDPKSDDYDLLLVTRRGATSHWWTTSGIMQKTGGTTISVDGTAQHSWSYEPADPAYVLILVGRDVKPYSANVRAAWASAKDAAQQLAEFY